METNLEFIKLFNQLILNRDEFQKHVIAKTSKSFVATPKMAKVASKYVGLTIKTVIWYRKYLSKSRIRPFPAICVLSLSEEQIFQEKSKENFLSFFREPRFENPTGDILIETKLLRLTLVRYNFFKSSIPIYFFAHCLSNEQQSEVLSLFDEAVKRLNKIPKSNWQSNLKVLYHIFELAVWFAVRTQNITLITTQSTMHRLPIAFEIFNSTFNRKMLWYSTNSQPIKRRGLPLEQPNFCRNLSRDIDMHYVWDLDSKQFLNSYGMSRVKAVGSILFIKRETTNQRKADFNLAYFDVTPFEHAENYYTAERMCVNLSRIVELSYQLSNKSNLKINLLVKPKRKLKASHSREYIHLLTKLEKEGKLKIINPSVNLYRFVSEVNCIIGIPFTSPVVIGRELNIPSAYIDTYVDDYQLPRMHNGFQVISEDFQFTNWLEEFLQHPSTR